MYAYAYAYSKFLEISRTLKLWIVPIIVRVYQESSQAINIKYIIIVFASNSAPAQLAGAGAGSGRGGSTH